MCLLGTRWGPQLCSWLETLREAGFSPGEGLFFFLLPWPDTAGPGPDLSGTEDTHRSHEAILSGLREGLCALCPWLSFLYIHLLI